MLLVFFVMATLVDYLTVKWHEAREQKRVTRLAALSGIIELLNWAPIWFALTQNDLSVALASIAGSIVGSVWGVRSK